MKAELEEIQHLLGQESPNPDKAIRLLNILFENESKHWLVYYFSGTAHMQKADYQKAIGYFEESISKHPENPHAYLMIARCCQALHDFDQAERFGKAAIQLDQRLLDGWLLMGEIYWQQSDLDKAKQCFTIANKLDPKNYLIAYKLAQIYGEQGDIRKALELYDVTLYMKPDFRDARIKKDAIYKAFGKNSQQKTGKYIHLCFNHLYAKSLSDMLGYVNQNYDQKHLLFVESHWAIEEYKPDISQDEYAVWFNHKYDLNAIIDRCSDSDIDGIFVHGLFFEWQKKLVQHIGSKKHIGWIIWGGDLYNPIKLKEPIAEVVEYIDSIHSLVEGDISVFNLTYGARPTYRFGYPYPGLYGDMPEMGEKKGRKKIIVGNSGDYSNNHIEILESLRKKEDVEQYDILLPVSYNLIPEYERAIKEWVKAAGMSHLVKLIKNFIEPAEYREFINASTMLITAHNRQQAIGNMLLSLYSGNATILKKEIVVNDEKQLNPTWELMQKYGLGVNSFEDFKKARSVSDFLSTSKKEINRQKQVIVSEFGMQKRAEDLVASCVSISERESEKVVMN